MPKKLGWVKYPKCGEAGVQEVFAERERLVR